MTRDEIEQSARAVLDALADGEELSTNQLASTIVGNSDAYDTQQAVKEVFTHLDALARGVLKTYWHKSPVPVMRFKRPAYPKRWHKQIAMRCPHCGGQL